MRRDDWFLDAHWMSKVPVDALVDDFARPSAPHAEVLSDDEVVHFRAAGVQPVASRRPPDKPRKPRRARAKAVPAPVPQPPDPEAERWKAAYEKWRLRRLPS